jgi:DNA mismatch repair protein MutS2
MPHRKTLESLGWASLLEYLAARTHTSRGAERARALELLDDIEAARRRSAEIAEARLLRELDEPLPFGGVHDIAAHLARASKGGDLDGPELVAVAQTVNATGRLKRHLTTHAATAPLLAGRAAPIALLAHVSGPILDSFEEGGRLSDNASAALGPMRRKVAALHEELSRRVKVLLDDPEISPYLQDRFYTQREDRYVVPLRAEARARVRGIVHGTSQSGHTVFVEPEVVVDLNNRLKLAESEVTEEEQRILAELSGYVREEAEAIGIAAAIAEELDLLDACARLADDTGASAAALGAPDLELRRARHPLMLLAGRTCVPNDIVLPAGKTLVISGPNAGGKTVALKTAGLAALMARAGLHLPVNDGSSVPWYLGVEVDIGDDQSLERNLSTFSAHVMNLVDFLERAGGETLLLVDELAVGTDPEQGSALAQAVLEAFADRGAQVIVTTHYERLKALPTATRASSTPRSASTSSAWRRPSSSTSACPAPRAPSWWRAVSGSPGRCWRAPSCCSATAAPASRNCSPRSPRSDAGSTPSAPPPRPPGARPRERGARPRRASGPPGRARRRRAPGRTTTRWRRCGGRATSSTSSACV